MFLRHGSSFRALIRERRDHIRHLCRVLYGGVKTLTTAGGVLGGATSATQLRRFESRQSGFAGIVGTSGSEALRFRLTAHGHPDSRAA